MWDTVEIEIFTKECIYELHLWLMCMNVGIYEKRGG